MLEIENLQVNYGPSPALRGVSLKVEEGELIAVIGANGAGKTTLLRTISGILKPRQGSISFMGKKISGASAHSIVRMGIVHVPEGRGTFYEMTTQENLEMGGYHCRATKELKQRMDKVYSIFPRLKERKNQVAGSLSGGEQQMLAVGRGLMAGPKVLLLDEPSLGLAPMLVEHLGETIRLLNKEHYITILLVEQNARMALDIASRGYALQTGVVVLQDSATNLMNNDFVKQAYLGI